MNYPKPDSQAERAAPLPPDRALAYTLRDAAAVTGISRASLYRLMKAGELYSVRVAGRRLIPSSALVALIGEVA
jgi:excisionase family DNA binding protein